MTDQVTLSVIVPFFNEQDNVEPMHRAIATAVEQLGTAFEMIFVDDGSSDQTLERAVQIAHHDERVRVVKLRHNFGQTAALAAGIQQAQGRVLVTMDGDLQNDPADIGALLAKIDDGYDVVVGWRFNRQDRLLSRKIPSRLANWLIGRVTGVPIRDTGCSLKAFRASIIKEIPLYSDMHRFVPAMVSLAGPRLAQIKVRHHARRFGKSKYGLSRTFTVLLDLVTIKTIVNFSSHPLRWFGSLAFPLLVAGSVTLAAGAWLAVATDVPVLPIAGSGLILLVTGANLVFGGVLAELVTSFGDPGEHRYSRLTGRVWGSDRIEPPRQGHSRD